MFVRLYISTFFFFNDTATTEIYTLSLHDALPISHIALQKARPADLPLHCAEHHNHRSEEHTSELQSHSDLVCRLLLEKKKKTQQNMGKSNILLYPHPIELFVRTMLSRRVV